MGTEARENSGMKDTGDWSCWDTDHKPMGEKSLCSCKDCLRLTNYKGYGWFSGWVGGVPELGEKCPYYQKPKMASLFGI